MDGTKCDARIIPTQMVSIVPCLSTKALRKTSCHEDTSLCVVCNNEIFSDAIIIGCKAWHPECFTCDLCLEPVFSNVFQVYNDHPVHTYCYNQLVGPHCESCSKSIAGCDIISAFGKNYHLNCLRCSKCQRSIGQNEEIDHLNHIPLCSTCTRLHNNICLRCNEKCGDDDTVFLFNGEAIYMHKKCSYCKECGSKLNNVNFVKEQNYSLCKLCWFKMGKFCCKICDEPTLPDERIIFNECYHIACFKCFNCGINLVNEDPCEISDVILCRKCYKCVDKNCAICFEDTNNNCIECFNRVFHPGCFKCSICRNTLNENIATFNKGRLVCSSCNNASNGNEG